MTKPADLANLKRVIELGSAEAARDVVLTPEQAAALERDMRPTDKPGRELKWTGPPSTSRN